MTTLETRHEGEQKKIKRWRIRTQPEIVFTRWVIHDMLINVRRQFNFLRYPLILRHSFEKIWICVRRFMIHGVVLFLFCFCFLFFFGFFFVFSRLDLMRNRTSNLLQTPSFTLGFWRCPYVLLIFDCLCCVFCFDCLSSVSCLRCSLCLLIIHSLTFIYMEQDEHLSF